MPAEPGGVLPVDKPEGPTSHDVVALARRSLDTRRIGHTGTLDPFASGLLLLCVGPATRLVELLIGLPKVYRGTVTLGRRTDTDDRTGATVAESDAWRDLERSALERVLARHTGQLLQAPPAYSARKVGGRRMHRLARAGKAAVAEPAPVTIYELRLLDFDPPAVALEIRCSSGTYIRALARDIGEDLGCHAHLSALRRVRIGSFDIEDALSPQALSDPVAVQRAWMRPARAIAHVPFVDIDAAEHATVSHGSPIAPPAGCVDSGQVALLHAGALVAIATASADWLRPRKVFNG